MSLLPELNSLGESSTSGCTGGYSHPSLSEKQQVAGCSFRACRCKSIIWWSEVSFVNTVQHLRTMSLPDCYRPDSWLCCPHSSAAKELDKKVT